MEIKERNLYLYEDIDQSSVNKIIKEIISINKSDEDLIKMLNIDDIIYKPKPIKIFIDSYGGSVYPCLGLISVIKSSKVPIHTIVTGCAMSCGFLISISGHKRFAYKYSTFLYHQISNFSIGSIKEIEDNLTQSKKLQNVIESHTIECTKISVDKLTEVYNKKLDWYIDAEEAITLGIIDEII
jgi:ATP-dependent Clp protease protease subunit